MKISALKKLLSAKMSGDNAEFILDDITLNYALCEVLRRTKPRTHIVKEVSKYFIFEHFRHISGHYYLRNPTTDLDDNALVDMEEELMSAVLYFLCSWFSLEKSDKYMQMAQNAICIYDTNITSCDIPPYLNIYLSKKADQQPIPVLKHISLAVGDSVEIMVDSNDGEVKANSLSPLIEVSINGDRLKITSNGVVDSAYVVISSDTKKYKIEVYSDESDGGIIS